jgi:hypothetical protein
MKQDACSGVHTSLKMATFVEGVMCSREVDRDTGGLDHINTTNKYNHDWQSSINHNIPRRRLRRTLCRSGYGQFNL